MFGLASRAVGDQHRVFVLNAIEVLDDQLVFVSPASPSDVVLSRVTFDFEPSGLFVVDGDYTQANGRVFLAGFGVFEFFQGRVERIGVVDQDKLADF